MFSCDRSTHQVTMSVKVTFQMELTELELKGLLDNRLTAAHRDSSVPEIEPKKSRKGDAPKTVKTIREMGVGNQPGNIKTEQGIAAPSRMVAQEVSNPAPAYITRVENLHDFLKNQMEDRNPQLLDLGNTGSWLH